MGAAVVTFYVFLFNNNMASNISRIHTDVFSMFFCFFFLAFAADFASLSFFNSLQRSCKAERSFGERNIWVLKTQIFLFFAFQAQIAVAVPYLVHIFIQLSHTQ